MSSLNDLMASFADKFRPHEDGSRLPSHHANCLGCGEDNPHGHRLEVRRAGDGVVAEHTFDLRHEGAPGIAHGGALATVIDDLYGFLQYLVGGPAVTRRLEIEYLRPVLLHTPYRLEAHLAGRTERRLEVEATITDTDERTVLTSTAVFVLVDVSHFAAAHPLTKENASTSAITEPAAETPVETGDPARVPRGPLP
ncbi:PaaI family thioesterase [Nocardioides silvaticus]|uniref:Acyl-coenzyme A thioesterase THEM4 n=2 Tax=Nocardioides silvaticus TaxID=2201891 RepID=A0A316TKI6_9ACTN|nr:PaaI family thioesterase [Nocardioides silvaticus]